MRQRDRLAEFSHRLSEIEFITVKIFSFTGLSFLLIDGAIHLYRMFFP
jgi:hypothetical protein